MKDFGIAHALKRHAMRRRIGNEKLHPEVEPSRTLKSSLAEHLMHKMAMGGMVNEDEEMEPMPLEHESEDFLASPPDEMTPDEQGLGQHEVDTYPPSHEFDVADEEEKRKKMGAAFSAMAMKRRKG